MIGQPLTSKIGQRLEDPCPHGNRYCCVFCKFPAELFPKPIPQMTARQGCTLIVHGLVETFDIDLILECIAIELQRWASQYYDQCLGGEFVSVSELQEAKRQDLFAQKILRVCREMEGK